jgi:ribosome-associated protein
VLSERGLVLPGPEVTHGEGDHGERVSPPTTADLRHRGANPGGGLLTTATERLVRTPTTTLPSLERACLCARVAADNKGRDVAVLDMRGITPLYDFFVLATGQSRRQIHTIAEETDAALHERGDARLSIEGYEASKWVVQDYGDVVVHVFDAPTREYYALEELWADAPHVDWEQHA